MAKLVILGTSNAIATEDHHNSHMVIYSDSSFVLIDCVDNPFVRLGKVGLNALEIKDLILTHFHPDHISGVPQFLMSSWLLGRREPLVIHGLAHPLNRVEKLMNFYDWNNWPNMYPVSFHRLPEQEHYPVLNNKNLRIFASPVEHLIPNIGVRVEFVESRKTMAYSCDTEPCEQVIRLGNRVDLLIHEATGAMPGHSSAAQAGQIARQANAAELCLIHYPVWEYDPTPLAIQASQTFGKPVRLCQDLMTFDF
jgi:ribonuclease Z